MYVDIAKWLWEQYGNDITHFAKTKWGQFNWAEAEQKYRQRLAEIHGTTRLLGHSKPINVSEIFTDVYVLDKLTAHRRFGVKELPEDEQDLDESIKRKSALRLALSQKKLFILGKPGAGKTTFLKYIVLKACEGKIKRTPIFVSLKEWSDSKGDLQEGLKDYLIRQFEICSFPDAKTFIDRLLKTGEALVLFDGLDEVKQEGNIRSEIIKLVNDFAKEYFNNQIIITCRLAAVEYSFEHFTYVEIADFNNKQTSSFVQKWYTGQGQKAKRFLSELAKPENSGFLELTKTPLLLTLLCLAYDELLEFPERRVDLYKEAFDALLKKWDASRDIQRDEIYKGLSTLRKENLLSRIAYQNFKKGKFFFRQEDITKQISDYLEQLPAVDTKQSLPDGEAVLKAIEAQHGLIVERAYGIYSFSHLTFQEYLTARFIVQNAGSGTLDELARSICLDQWSEVVSITASLLDNADIFILNMYSHLNEYLISNTLINLFAWLENKSAFTSNPKFTRASILLWHLFREYLIVDKKAHYLALDRTKFQELNEKIEIRHLIKDAMIRALWVVQKLGDFPRLSEINDLYDMLFINNGSGDDYYTAALDVIQETLNDAVIRELEISMVDLEKQFNFTKRDCQNVISILDGTIVILESLDLAIVSDRNKLKNLILLNPKESTKF